jgi:CheY-like chemotaxis protein
LAVADTGIGIDPARLGQLFQPFTQEDQSTTRRFGGTGLGLSISRRLARLLGGDLTAVSAPHKGSTFTATIAAGPLDGVPMLDHVPEAVALPIAPGSPVPTAPPQLTARILLAEDGPDNQRLLVRFLHTAGATVECVENGRLAVERLLGSRGTGVPPVSFDLILMDMQMPEMDGYTATRTLRDAGVRLPIIALTAHAMAGEREKCLDAGCSDYLAKPITKPALLEACRRWLTLPAKAAA